MSRRKVVMVLVALAAAGVLSWRRNPRLGTRLVNERVNPFLMRHAFSEGGHAEAASLEHVGRRSGTRRLTLVHPVPVEGGFRIIVPLGQQSEWARNVVAAGHTRMSMRGVTYQLDEPSWLEPSDVAALPRPMRALQEALGFRYLHLRVFAERPGSLEPGDTDLEGAPREPAVAT